jgi:hypothetical protein
VNGPNPNQPPTGTGHLSVGAAPGGTIALRTPPALEPLPEPGVALDVGVGLDERPRGKSPKAPSRGRAWLVRHRHSLIVAAVLMVVVGVVHGVGMDSYPAPVDDEGTYVAQAWALVARHALTPYTYWYDHPPLGWMVLAAWAALSHGFRSGQSALDTGRQMILIAQLVGTGLLFAVARRLGLSRGWSAAAVLFWALSPLDVTYGRMVYLDNLAVTWMLASFLLALTPRRNLWALCTSGVLFAAAVLSKETLLIFAPALLWQVWQQSGRRTRAFCLTGFLASFCLVVSAYPLYAVLKGELLPGPGHVSLLGGIRFQLASRQSTGNVLSAHSQAHALVANWLSLDPWLLGLGLVLLPVALIVRRLRPVGVGYVMALLVMLHGGYLPQPYVIAVLPFAALAAVGSLHWAWAEAAARIGRRDRRLGWLARLVVGAGTVLVVLAAGPGWAQADGRAMTTDQWAAFHGAENWVEANVPHPDRILVDDTFWVDLEDHGFNRHLNVVWFYKLGYANNLDPSVTRSLPGGWKDFAYVVDSPSMRAAIAADPSQETEVRDAVTNSTVVARFGQGAAQIDIRRINHRGAASVSTAKY